jgi:hypothetical protein
LYNFQTNQPDHHPFTIFFGEWNPLPIWMTPNRQPINNK